MPKISFLGDIMCERPLLKAAVRNHYDFSSVFEPLRSFLSRSDQVVGNLESPMGGPECGYTDDVYSFNTPDSFADALKNVGIDAVTTANNHCLDRGIEGIVRTLKVLDQRGIAHTGTFASPEDRERPMILNVKGINIAILSYTSETNFPLNHKLLTKNKLFHVNLTKRQTVLDTLMDVPPVPKSCLQNLVEGPIFRIFKLKQHQLLRLSRLLRFPHYFPITDAINKGSLNPVFLESIKNDIIRAKKETDFVVVCLHCGGQFNAEPGKYHEYMIRYMADCGADAVIGNHPHNVQKMIWFPGNVPASYCLGNFSMSLNSPCVVFDNKPEYSVVLHFLLDKIDGKTMLQILSFSILKTVNLGKNWIAIYPTDELYQSVSKREQKRLYDDILFIYNRFTNQQIGTLTVKDEYVLYERKD